MKPWLIFGAGGTGTGRCVLDLALAAGRPVVAVVRNPSAAAQLDALGVAVVEGDARDAQAVALACTKVGHAATVISTLGGAQEFEAHRVIIDTAAAQGLERMIMVSSLGCGDSWRWLSARAKAAFGQSVREKTLAEAWLQTSPLDYAILRPGGLLNGEATGMAQLFQGEEVHGFVHRRDVAAMIARLDAADSLNNQVYSLVQPGLAPETA
ncbi:SDR family oxidoreductase [Mixta intestinalis]|uniref:Putative sugar epimerase YhfK n=1 Tax=Mixta intestinalis TaxID=1615494 RepID=A0A6P1Q0B7_9GAMM|nr:SDR family oxidoreductase [Mixta intestinalis]QHM72386.1 putative sugar epimerase YhfK [Mixta intestinalis]